MEQHKHKHMVQVDIEDDPLYIHHAQDYGQEAPPPTELPPLDAIFPHRQEAQHQHGTALTPSFPPAGCFNRAPHHLSFPDALAALLRMPIPRDRRAELLPWRPDADDCADVLRHVDRCVPEVLRRSSVRELVRQCALSDDDVRALVVFKLEHPFAVGRWLNVWLASDRRDAAVVNGVGPYFARLQRALEKLPVVAKRDCELVAAVEPRWRHEQLRQQGDVGTELHLWGLVSFATGVSAEESSYMPGVSEEGSREVDGPNVVRLRCGEVRGVVLDMFRPARMAARHEILPLAPSSWKVVKQQGVLQEQKCSTVVSLVQSTPTAPKNAYVRSTVLSKVVALPYEDRSATSSFLSLQTIRPTRTQRLRRRRCANNTILDVAVKNDTMSLLVTPIRSRVKLLASKLQSWKRSRVWLKLGSSLDETSTINTGGTAHDRVSCFAEGLQLAPEDPLLWAELGAALDPTKAVVIGEGGKRYDQMSCFSESLTLNEANSDTWIKLGVALQRPDGRKRGERRSFSFGGKSYTSHKCFTKAVNLNNNMSYLSWYHLASSGCEVWKDAFQMCLQLNPTFTAGWVELGKKLASCEEKTIEVNGRQVNSFNCFENAIALDARNSEIWREFALIVPHASKLVANGSNLGRFGKMQTAVQCFVMAIESDPTNARAWKQLGEIENDQRDEGKLYTINGVEYSPQQCILKAVMLASSSPPPKYALDVNEARNCWYTLFLTMIQRGRLTHSICVGEYTVTIPLCAASCLALNENDEDVWEFLALALHWETKSPSIKIDEGQEATVVVNGTIHTETTSIQQHIRLLMHRERARRESAAKYNGKALARSCIEKLQQNSQSFSTWHSVGEFLESSKSVDVDGVQYSKQECFVKAIELDETDGRGEDSWFYLAQTVETADGNNQAVTVNGKRYTKRECLVQFLELAPDDPTQDNCASSLWCAWIQLATECMSSDDDRVVVRDVSYSREECFELRTKQIWF